MKLKYTFLYLVTLAILMYGCSAMNIENVSIQDQAYNKLSQDEKIKIQRASPVQLIELYVQGINEKNPYLTISTLSNENTIIAKNENLEIVASKYKGMLIRNLVVKNSDENQKFKENYNTFRLVIKYNLEVIDENPIPNGPGEYYYFVDFVKENNMWKIKNLSTSP